MKVDDVISVETVTFDSGNYTGVSFAAEFERKVNAALLDSQLSLAVSYDLMNNKLQMVLSDDRSMVVGDAEVAILANADINLAMPRSLNGVLMLSETANLIIGTAFSTYLDLHTTRNLYLTSSSLGSYNTVSNFGYDTIIKKIPVRFNYNEMLFDGAESGYDYLDVSKRSLRRIDFRLQDAFSNIVNLNGNHWSFSLIFQLLD